MKAVGLLVAASPPLRWHPLLVPVLPLVRPSSVHVMSANFFWLVSLSLRYGVCTCLPGTQVRDCILVVWPRFAAEARLAGSLRDPGKFVVGMTRASHRMDIIVADPLLDGEYVPKHFTPLLRLGTQPHPSDLQLESNVYNTWRRVRPRDNDTDDSESDSEAEKHTLEGLLSKPELLEPLLTSTHAGQKRKEQAPAYDHHEREFHYERDWSFRCLAAVSVSGEGPFKVSMPFMCNWNHPPRDSLPISMLKYLQKHLGTATYEYRTDRHKAGAPTAPFPYPLAQLSHPSATGRGSCAQWPDVHIEEM